MFNNTHRSTLQEVVDTFPARYQSYLLRSFLFFFFFLRLFSLCILIFILLSSFLPFNWLVTMLMFAFPKILTVRKLSDPI